MTTPLALVAGRYRLLEEIGQGADGRVFLADTPDDAATTYAVKAVPPFAAARLRTELDVLARVAHPSLVSVIELVTCDVDLPPPLTVRAGTPLLVMTHAPGERVDIVCDRVRADSKALARTVVSIGLDVTRALAALHAAGVVHGDVKPANIVARPDGAMLVDLGSASAPGWFDAVSGTPAYFAPESWVGERSFATDLFALGATLHDLLSGAKLESSSRSLSRGEIRETHRGRLSDSVPASLAALVRELLSSSRDERPARALDIVARLEMIAKELGAPHAKSLTSSLVAKLTPAEHSARVLALGPVGRADEVEQLAALVRAGDAVVVVHGPRGVGKTLVIREAVRRVQGEALASGVTVPAFRSASAKRHGDAMVSIVHADGTMSANEASAFVAARRIAGGRCTVIIESLAVEAGTPSVQIAPLPADRFERLVAAIADVRGSPPASLYRAIERATARCPGRAVRRAAAIFASGGDASRAETWSARGEAGETDALPTQSSVERLIVDTLAAAGGALPAETLIGLTLSGSVGRDAVVRALRALATEALVTAGAERDELTLRDDVVIAARAALSEAFRRAIAPAILRLSGASSFARASAALLVHESERADALFRDAITRTRRGGDAALALDAAERASALGGSRAMRVIVADLRRAMADYDGAEAALRQDPNSDTDVLRVRAEVARLRGEPARAVEMLEGADESLLVAIRARARFDLRNTAAARVEALRVVERVGAPVEARARAADVLALVALAERTTDAAIEVDRALDEARTASPEALARAHALRALLLRERGDRAAVAAMFGVAVELAEDAGERHAAAVYRLNRGAAELDVGDLAAALRSLRDGAAELASLGRPAEVGRALYNLGVAALLVGDQDLFALAVREARTALTGTGDIAALDHLDVLSALGRERADARGGLDAYAALADLTTPRAQAIARARALRLRAELGATDLELLAEARTESDPVVAIERGLANAWVLARKGDASALVHALEVRARARNVSFDATLEAALVAAAIAGVLGETNARAAVLGEARGLLDRAIVGLPAADRARMRSMTRYLAAFDAVPRGETTPHEETTTREVVRAFKRVLGARGRVADALLETVLDLTGAESATLMRIDDDGAPRTLATRGLHGTDPTRAQFSRTLVARARAEGRPFAVVDAGRDSALAPAASVHSLSLRSVAVVPLRGEDERILFVDDRLRPGAFDERILAAVADLADVAGLAIESGELLARQQDANDRLERMRGDLERLVAKQGEEIATLRHRDDDTASIPGLVARSEAMRSVIRLVQRVAVSNAPVLILGESGTGKELIARAIHARSARQRRAFVSENCGAIPDTLAESAFFGHVRGAFSGADRSRVGLFEAADGGTLFLDEVGEMSASMQAKLLRALQSGEVRAVGSDATRTVDVRVVAATHRALETAVEEGAFREDLYYRLAVVVIRVPPLRERPEDIAPIVAHILEREGRGDVRVDRRAIDALAAYAWPGNVRELENEITRALVVADDSIRVEHLSPAIVSGEPVSVDDLDLRGQVDRLERRLIIRALEESQSNQTRAAHRLGVSRFGLQKMMKRLGLRP